MRRAQRILLVLGATCLMAVGAVGLSAASFSAQKANPNNTFTAATSFCSAPGLQTVTANRDTFVEEDSTADTNGDSQTLDVKARSSKSRHALVGFSLPSVPTNCSVTLATLKLTTTASTTGRTILAYQIAASGTWTESGANWSNKPGTTGTPASSASGSGTRTWSVTSLVQAMYNGTNNGFLLKDQDETPTGSGITQTYASREHPTSSKPTLEVTFG
jgi:large repetitive protein